MGVSEKHQVEVGVEHEMKKWVIAGIPIRAPLKKIRTKKIKKDVAAKSEEEETSTTPTGEEARIPERLPCPPPPRKQRPSLKCNFSGVREFFNPPDLESVFIRHVET